MDGKAIRKARLERKWTQEDLAKLVGRSQATISTIEKGKTPIPEELRESLKRAFEHGKGAPARREPLREPLPRFALPNLRPPRPMPIEVGGEWRRPKYSGDFLLLLPLAAKSVLVVAVDVAGHGAQYMPASIFLQGWLRGWTRALNSPPRLETLAEELSRELRSAGVEAGCFFALLSPQPGLRHTVSYEAIAYGFPPPLLITGPPFRTPESADLAPPLDENHPPAQPKRIDRLTAPWRLVVATDGLLRRLGKGDEQRGIRSLREWQTGPRRDELPRKYLHTTEPIADDELFAMVRWRHWDEEVEFPVYEDGARHGAIAMVGQRLELTVGKKRSVEFQSALMEALENARMYGQGDAGMVRVRFRAEEEFYRVEVEDEGMDAVDEGRLRARESGFAVMRHWAADVEVRHGAERGTVVSLIIEKEPTPGV